MGLDDLENTESNGRDEEIASFFAVKDSSLEYAKFADIVVPPDRIGYDIAHAILAANIRENDLPAIALDFGCHTGSSSARLLKNLRRHLGDYVAPENVHIVGVDSVMDVIDTAKSTHEESGNLRFINVKQQDSFPNPLTKDVFSAAMWGFVDPVIPNNKVLFDNLKKVHDSMREGGMIVLLRRAAESFHPKSNFAFYGHSVNPRLTPDSFRQPEPIENRLTIPVDDDVESIKFVDYVRAGSFITKLLAAVGFGQVFTHQLHNNGISDNAPYADLARSIYERMKVQLIEQYPEMEEKDDFDKPQLELICAIK